MSRASFNSVSIRMRAHSNLVLLLVAASLVQAQIHQSQATTSTAASGYNFTSQNDQPNNRSQSNFEHERFKRRIKTSNLPEFSAPIGNVSAVLGRDVRLICTVEHLGQYQVAWLKEETKTILSIDTNIITTNYRIFLIPDEEERKWVLHIKDVQGSDRGFYQCQVNTIPVRSTTGYLEVVVPPTIIESQTSQVTEVIEHSNVSIQCKANGHPKPTISWRRDDGIPIRLNGIFNTKSELDLVADTSLSRSDTITSALDDVKSDKLSLYNVHRSMAGIYVCTAFNGIPTHANKRIPLYVKFPPETSIQSKYISVSLGEQLQVDCIIEAFPKANSYWSKKSIYPQTHRGKPARWLHSAESDRRALSPKPNLSADELDSIKIINSTSAPIDEVNSVELDMKLYQKQNFQAQYKNHPHNRLQLRQANHQSLVNGDGAESFLNMNQSPLISELNLGEPESSSLLSKSEKAYVTVKQTALNSYTYTLKLTIARMQLDDYGEYSCISTNSMGSSESHVVVTNKIGISKWTAQPNSSSRSVEENEYQRDSLESKSSGQSSNGTRRGSTYNHVYDENYLQAIKTRQNNGSLLGRYQQKLKSRQYQGRNSASNQKSALSVINILPILVYAQYRLLIVS